MKLALFVVCVVLCVGVAHGAVGVRTFGGETYVPIPQGYMLDRCVWEVESGTEIKEDPGTGGFVFLTPLSPTAGGGVSVRRVECDSKDGAVPVFVSKAQMASGSLKPGTLGVYDGWQAYTSYEYPEGLDTFLGDFSTPAAKPKHSPEVDFIFTGLQNVPWIPLVDPEPTSFDIVQPVTQYPATAVSSDGEESPEFGGSWGVRSWYVTLHQGAVYSKVALLEDGDVVFGNMTRTGPQSFFVGSTNKRNGETVTIKATNSRLTKQPYAYNTLETYGAPDCDYVPNAPSYFTNLVLTSGDSTVTPQWVAHLSPTQKCSGSKCVIVNPATVTIDMGDASNSN